MKSTECMDAYSYVNCPIVHNIWKVVLCAIVELCNSIRILTPQKRIIRWKTHSKKLENQMESQILSPHLISYVSVFDTNSFVSPDFSKLIKVS